VLSAGGLRWWRTVRTLRRLRGLRHGGHSKQCHAQECSRSSRSGQGNRSQGGECPRRWNSFDYSDGILGDKDAATDQTSWTGDARVSGDGETEGPIDRFVGWVDADSGRYLGFRNEEPVMADLKWRGAIGEIKRVVGGASDAHCLAQPAGARGELTG
jgi:hypothetical protein